MYNKRDKYVHVNCDLFLQHLPLFSCVVRAWHATSQKLSAQFLIPI